MATAPNTMSRGATHKKESLGKDQLRKDRIKGIAVLVVLAALMALMIWLASMGNGAVEDVNDYWPMMP